MKNFTSSIDESQLKKNDDDDDDDDDEKHCQKLECFDTNDSEFILCL